MLSQAAGMQELVDDAIKAWAGVLRIDMQPMAGATRAAAASTKQKTSRKQRAQARHAAEKELPLSVSEWLDPGIRSKVLGNTDPC